MKSLYSALPLSTSPGVSEETQAENSFVVMFSAQGYRVWPFNFGHLSA
jgi:hypothetical protein